MAVKRRKFKTEVQQLLNLVIHSLYTHPEIFLRELISNASDAVDRARFEALSDKTILGDDADWKVRIIPNKAAKTLTISDNGIGMSVDELEKNIGTIANSGTRHFMEQLKDAKESSAPELIGQFGVGFYSAFMVADKVTLITRRAGSDTALKWVSDGAGSYTIEEVEKASRGTDIILHLKEGMEEYLDEWRLRKIIKTYSDFVEHPVVMDITRTRKKDDSDEEETTVTEETLNSRKAIWTRPKSEVTDEEYNEFYKHISHDFQDPAAWMHWNVEGTTEFRGLIYLPAKAPYDLFTPDASKRGVQLYVRRVFITDKCDALVPSWLRFLRGVVDSSDLPLNVSRETLQEERVIRVIQKNVVKKVLDTLSDMLTNDREKYTRFWKEFGKVLKEGIHLDLANREKLEELALFESSKTAAGDHSTLKEYVDRMPESQKEIYYITGESRAAVEKSPLLEQFTARDIEVLFLTDPIDEWVTQSMNAYADKPLKSIAKGDIELDDSEDVKKEKEETDKQFAELVAFLKEELKDKVKDIRMSNRLTDSACCLVSDEYDMGVHMEKIMRAMHGDETMPGAKRILELNPGHSLVTALNGMVKNTAKHVTLKKYAGLLVDQAKLTAGMELDNPVDFARDISAIMAESLTK
ncbi:MAG: molecular chaperone HtpG [Lentisphaeria bacterium]|nr:molecular chaperone HtpG [Lentisphaeria bacterium]